jgi:hypothetical protein
MKKQLFLSLAETLITCIALITLSITSCSKLPTCEDRGKTITKFLRDSTLLQIPFTGTDTLIYVSNYDTATLYGQGYERQIVTEKLPWDDSGCPQYDIYDTEELNYVFRGTNPNFNYFRFLVGYNQVYDLYENEWITFFYQNKSTRSLVIQYNDTSSYKFEVKIKNKEYYGYTSPLPSMVYNKRYGVLQFKINDTLTYTLNNIKQ